MLVWVCEFGLCDLIESGSNLYWQWILGGVDVNVGLELVKSR